MDTEQKRVRRTRSRLALCVGLIATFALSGCTSEPSSKDSGEPKASADASPTAVAEREPKNLEAKLTIVMGEEKPLMFFSSEEGTRGGPFKLPSGKVVGIKVVNSGKLEHEIAFGRALSPEGAYTKNLFESQAVDLFVFKPVKMEVEDTLFGEIEVEPGAVFWIRTTFPAELKGEWEIGCFVEGHYDAGMKATFVIE